MTRQLHSYSKRLRNAACLMTIPKHRCHPARNLKNTQVPPGEQTDTLTQRDTSLGGRHIQQIFSSLKSHCLTLAGLNLLLEAAWT